MPKALANHQILGRPPGDRPHGVGPIGQAARRHPLACGQAGVQAPLDEAVFGQYLSDRLSAQKEGGMTGLAMVEVADRGGDPAG